ncbi:unnamed protein product [Adineta steineri]|uniref:Homeobox domain-containing protein n=1 Tax=Adineta steineri TaxID=433720 RepID=A0A818TE72_9BILA|nr:unnamed protein product [Adineta steineri]CAF1168677.1 unnamed protein product [Adineta steineri]CAF1248625.1 unnamed protein product [Adineta steineri]CAF1278970.1 unnamed protein product [Adineta steineri]CAF1439761.1 unnamed protein product [Adineta steineri]
MVSRRLDKLSAGLALSNKFLPVHCVVARDECPQRVLQDGFVIVPAHTKFHEIVSVVLRTMEADVGRIEQDERADGQILIKNWNPLPIPTVTENRTVTVQEILGDLMNVAVLQIRISKYSNTLDDKRSVRLLKHLMPLVSDERDKHELVNKLCQVMHDDTEDDDDGLPQSSSSKPTTSPNGYSIASSNSNTTDGDNIPLNLSTKPYSSPSMPMNSTKSFINYPFASLLSLAQHQQYDSPPVHASSTIKDYAYSRRQRERTTFDPHEETPRLLQIFTDTKHPTRYQIASICESLNALPCRKGKKALEPYNIQYWFKNARAALKRKKRRFTSSETPTSQQFIPSLPHQIENHDEQNHTSVKCELDSSDEIDDDDDDDIDIDEKQKQQNHNNYYFNYLQAFDISLTDQQRQKTTQSDESNDDDNMSSVSEQTPPTQISFNSTKISNNTTTSFDYNRSRRNRIFIDPASEVPKLEQWFAIETHPDHILIERICSELNEGEYRTKFPKLESKHIRLWFKNHRAKVKRICRIQTPNLNNNNNDTTIETTEKEMHNVQ